MANLRKAVTAVLGAVAQVVAYVNVPASDREIVAALVALATALGVYVVPNKAATK